MGVDYTRLYSTPDGAIGMTLRKRLFWLFAPLLLLALLFAYALSQSLILTRFDLQDANLLKLRITYGIPAGKQIPLAGPFMASALAVLDPADGDTPNPAAGRGLRLVFGVNALGLLALGIVWNPLFAWCVGAFG